MAHSLLVRATAACVGVLLGAACASGLELSRIVRVAFPPDVVNEFSLISGAEDPACPRNITHTTWNGIQEDDIIGLPHNTIIHDGTRCNSVSNERHFVMYSNEVIARGGEAIPTELLDTLQIDGRNIRTKFEADKLGERYYVGYESLGRFCDPAPKFDKGATGFLMRPFERSVSVTTNNILINPGGIYLLMLPQFSSTECLYEANVELLESPMDSGEATPVPSFELFPEPSAGLEGPSEIDDNSDPERSVLPVEEVCFPSTATVKLESGDVIPISEVEIGHKVQVGKDMYSPVFMFTHKMGSATNAFLKLTTASGQKLSLTAGHFLYVNDDRVMAKDVRRGDRLHLGDGSSAVVERIEKVFGKGLYNPQTVHGDIVVDGIRASTYTVAVEPECAHALLSPLRALYKFLLVDPSLGLLNYGSHFLASLAPSGGSVAH